MINSILLKSAPTEDNFWVRHCMCVVKLQTWNTLGLGFNIHNNHTSEAFNLTLFWH